MINDDRDELDDAISAALPEYSKADPLDGLEERVLRRVRVAAAARQTPWPFGLWFAIPAVAALLLVGIALRVGWNSKSQNPDSARRAAVTVPAPAPATRVAAPKPAIRMARERSAPVETLPKEEYFPAPVPLTNEERVLAAWARRAPSEIEQVFAEAQKESTEPIAIRPIQIPPLQIDGAQ